MPVWDFPNPPFGKEICHHSEWDQITQGQESAGSAVDCNPRGDRANRAKKYIIIYNVFDG